MWPWYLNMIDRFHHSVFLLLQLGVTHDLSDWFSFFNGEEDFWLVISFTLVSAECLFVFFCMCVIFLFQILFMNKIDLFQDKILRSERHLRLYLPQFKGRTDVGSIRRDFIPRDWKLNSHIGNKESCLCKVSFYTNTEIALAYWCRTMVGT